MNIFNYQKQKTTKKTIKRGKEYFNVPVEIFKNITKVDCWLEQ
jgi:hypothetical protein